MRRIIALTAGLLLALGLSAAAAPPAAAYCIQVVEGGGCLPCPDLESRLIRVYCLM
jgi:hypothetical protein